MNGEGGRESGAPMRAEDIDADFVDVWILVPDSGHGQRRSGGAHDGEGGAGGGDAAVLFGFSKGIFELQARPERRLLWL